MMRINKNEMNCCGCGNCILACPSRAIAMKRGARGFYIPEVDMEKCTGCGKCVQACALEDLTLKRKSGGRRVAAFKMRNKRERLRCQSGGAFSAIAGHFFSIYKNAAVYGVTLNETLMKAEYIRIGTPGEIVKLAGSKYVQADMSNVQELVEKDLKDGRHVIFSGTPCHVAAVKKYLELKNTDADSLITVDIICHGVISPKLFEDYIGYAEKYLGGG